jgi:hypothetical protein
MSEAFVRKVFLASAAFLAALAVFSYGLLVGKHHIWPYATISSAWRAGKTFWEFGELVPEGRRVRAPAGASRDPVTIHDPNRIAEGSYVFLGWDSQSRQYAAWLYDNGGRRLHTWRIDYLALDPDGPSNGSDSPHPFSVLPDGSIVVGFARGDVMARLDECGTPIWIKNGIYHHELTRGDDGTFWVWRGEGTAFGSYHYLENFDGETGRPIRELALIEDIIRNMGASAAIFGVRPDEPFRKLDRDPVNKDKVDIFHPNDVDVLDSSLAPMFPMFAPGDLLLSFRTLNLVAVIGPDNGRVKWWSHGPWVAQHDPDFTSDGKISVYNNTERGRSEILQLDTATREISNDLLGGEVSFASATMGSHQYMPNGNLLIVVPDEGRVLEVTASGSIVMEFNNLSSRFAAYNEHVENGVWLPPGYFQTVPDCSTTTIQRARD